MAERMFDGGRVMLMGSDALATSCRRVRQGVVSAAALRDAEVGLAAAHRRLDASSDRLARARARRAVTRAALAEA